MNKKEFYEAPKWGLRTVRVERQYLQSTSDWGEEGRAGQDLGTGNSYSFDEDDD